MKKLFLFLLPMMLLSSCSIGGKAREVTNYHILQAGEDKTVLTQEQFVEKFKANYHKSNKYDNVKTVITCDRPFSDIEGNDSPYSNLEHVDIMSTVCHKLFENHSDSENYNKVNFAANFDQMYITLSNIDRHFVTRIYCRYCKVVERLNAYIEAFGKGETSFTAYSFSVQTSNILLHVEYDKDYYPVSWSYQMNETDMGIGLIKYDYQCYYFNVNDCANTKKEVDYETYAAAFIAHGNQPYQTKRAHVVFKGNVGVIVDKVYDPDYDVYVHIIEEHDAKVEFFYQTNEYPYETPICTGFLEPNNTVSYYSDPVFECKGASEKYLEGLVKQVANMFPVYLHSFFYCQPYILTPFHIMNTSSISKKVPPKFYVSPLSGTGRICMEDDATDDWYREYAVEWNDRGLITEFKSTDVQDGKKNSYTFTVEHL